MSNEHNAIGEASDVLLINECDSVVVALKDLLSGHTVEFNKNGKVEKVELLENITRGHKIAIVDIPQNSLIIKYGQPIATAKAAIKKGAHVHVHNTVTTLEESKSYTYQPSIPKLSKLDINFPEKVKAFKRNDGNIGIRNDIWMIPTVGCVNSYVANLSKQWQEKHPNPDGVVDGYQGVVTISHPYGCSQLGADFENTRKFIRRLLEHPNAGGILLVGLGCEENLIERVISDLPKVYFERLRYITLQQESDEYAVGHSKLEELYNIVKKDVRTDEPSSKLVVGLKCGGSDGLSGITANSLLGKFTEQFTLRGGAAVLTEIPEAFGAEVPLFSRCETKAVFDKALGLIDDFKNFYRSNNLPVYENPSPGNKAGGITTLEDKSLGCVQKAGLAPVIDVVRYCEPVTKHGGVTVLEAPGNDLVAISSLLVSGCHFVFFTTGRGTPFGSIIPTIKVSSNTEIYNKKKDWIDFDAGALLREPVNTVLQRFVDTTFDIVNNRRANNELNGYREIAIFKTGVTL